MPFTFSHAALILPVYHLNPRLSLTGLMVGSLIPDIEYYIRFKKDLSQYGHNIGGVFWFDLPLAILLSFLFHKVVRNQIIHNSPDYIFRRFALCSNFSWTKYFRSHYMLVIFSILLGVFSHLLWDGALHYYFGESNEENVQFDFGNLDYETSSYRLVHLINSVLGLVVLFLFVHKMPVISRVKKIRFPGFWTYIIVLTGCGLLCAFAYTSDNDVEDWTVIVISCLGISIFAICTYQFLFEAKIIRARKRQIIIKDQ